MALPFGQKDKTPKTFPGQEKGEKIYLFLRRHPLSFLGFLLMTIFMILAPFIVYYATTQIGGIEASDLARKIIIVIASAYTLFVLGFFLVGWIDYYLDVVIITNRRLIDINQDRLFARNIAEANLVDVEDVNAEVKGILNTLFHFGTVHVQTAGTLLNFEFKFIPNPYKVAKMIADLHEEAVEEEEKREAREIGETIVEKTGDSNDVSQEEITSAAKKLSERKRQKKTRPMTRQEIRHKEEDKPHDYKEYGESDLEDKYPQKEKREGKPPRNEGRPTADPSRRAKADEPEVQKDNDTFNHDDLEKGGEIDL